MLHMPLRGDHPLAGVALVPGPIEVLGGASELHDEVAGQVLGLSFPAFLAPELDEGRLIVAHDDPGVRATDEGAAVRPFRASHGVSPYNIFINIYNLRF